MITKNDDTTGRTLPYCVAVRSCAVKLLGRALTEQGSQTKSRMHSRTWASERKPAVANCTVRKTGLQCWQPAGDRALHLVRVVVQLPLGVQHKVALGPVLAHAAAPLAQIALPERCYLAPIRGCCCPYVLLKIRLHGCCCACSRMGV